jgi:Bax protein
MRYVLATLALVCATFLSAFAASPPSAAAQGENTAATDSSEVVVVTGIPGLIEFLQAENWWGPEPKGEALNAPRLMITAIKPSWQEAAKKLTVPEKKQIFYRLMLPLVMHANDMVMDFRGGLEQAAVELARDETLAPESLALVQRLAILLPGIEREDANSITATTPELQAMIDGLLYRVDAVPAGLALGQAAYESGYGTSRFAVEGNSLFGQWTYKGDGIKPGQQRKALGDHQIKAFEWPFDSVRGYFINLMSHPAYEDFRRLRAELRAAGKPLDSLVLADGLMKYSERGQAYVDSLKGIIRVNKLDRADHASFRDEPLRFLVSAADPDSADELERTIRGMRENGELQQIIERMRLE